MTEEDKSIQQDGENLFQSTIFANSIEMMKQNFTSYIQQMILYNKLRKVKYDSLIDEGFTEAQAMEIIIKVNLFN